MDPYERLRLIAVRLESDDEDPRHTVLDVAKDFIALADILNEIPASLREELIEIADELAGLLPRFPSHRKTSKLFDREGLGRPGQKLARTLARRIIAVSEAARRLRKREG